MTDSESMDIRTTVYTPAQRSLVTFQEGVAIAGEIRMLLDTHRVVVVDMSCVEVMNKRFVESLFDELVRGVKIERPGWVASSCVRFRGFRNSGIEGCFTRELQHREWWMFNLVNAAFRFDNDA
ncbi:MAG: hypothetical protein EA376_00840 [Phycisphaeraceae bacterium]|nr:MAG: hypothetical protein EA376_00840 [Phycisphaeraceae bacterium]